MPRCENDRLVKDDRGNSFLYWWPPAGREGEASDVDLKTMGISHVPGEPAGIAIILKEPGKAGADDVTRMFPEDGSIGEAGYGVPYDSLNVVYNHEWWTCLCDEVRKKRHIEVCCKDGRDGATRGGAHGMETISEAYAAWFRPPSTFSPTTMPSLSAFSLLTSAILRSPARWGFRLSHPAIKR